MSQPQCGDRRIRQLAALRDADHIYYKARPILHEPGPFDTRYFMSRTASRCARANHRLNAAYDNSARTRG